MKYLLDTHTLIWALTSPSLLSEKVKAILENPEETIVVSAISFWEISMKYGLGRLELGALKPSDFIAACNTMDIEILPLEARTCASYHQLEVTYHRDPFDRMLLWLAKQYDLTLLSKDRQFKYYASLGIKVMW